MQHCFESLARAPTIFNPSLVATRLPGRFGWAAEDSRTAPGRFDKILRFATVDSVKAGWMLNNKGIWTIAYVGKVALQQFTNPAEFYREASRLPRHILGRSRPLRINW